MRSPTERRPLTRRFLPLSIAAVVTIVLATCVDPGIHSLGPEASDLAVVTAYAPASLVVDQQQMLVDTGAPTLAIGGASTQRLAQVVTAGIDGRLRRVRVPVGCSAGDLILEIQSVTSGEPDGGVLASRTTMGSRFPSVLGSPPVFSEIHLGRGVDFVAGDQFAIVLDSSGTCAIQSAPLGDLYGGGDAFFEALPNPPGWERLDLGLPGSFPTDLAFETLVRP